MFKKIYKDFFSKMMYNSLFAFLSFSLFYYSMLFNYKMFNKKIPLIALK